jgi:hypothetical protein
MSDHLEYRDDECSRLRDLLDAKIGTAPAPVNLADATPSQEALANVLAVLPASLQAHAARCEHCRAAAAELVATRALLSALPSRAPIPGPWFAPRVMAAIAAQESKLTRALDTWLAIPKLASKLAWASAFALLLMSTWLYQRPATHSGNSAVLDITGEPVQETAPPATNDDVLVSLAGNYR